MGEEVEHLRADPAGSILRPAGACAPDPSITDGRLNLSLSVPILQDRSCDRLGPVPPILPSLTGD